MGVHSFVEENRTVNQISTVVKSLILESDTVGILALALITLGKLFNSFVASVSSSEMFLIGLFLRV